MDHVKCTPSLIINYWVKYYNQIKFKILFDTLKDKNTIKITRYNGSCKVYWKSILQ